MEKAIKTKPIMTCCFLFAICLWVRLAEYFVIRTDETVIGENLFHKLAGIILLFCVLKAAGIKWSEIGFGKHGLMKSILQGLLLSVICFALSYGVEIIFLSMRGNAVHMEFYINGFSLTETAVKNTEMFFFLICVVFNFINVWMEEGLFRGFFIKVISGKYSFMQANLASALLFGVWHFVMPVRSFVNGEMAFGQMLLLTVGYILLLGLMSIKWGLLYKMTGTLWAGAADHFFNNAVATNMLHVVTDSGADEMQIVRMLLAQVVSASFVAVIYRLSKRKL